ncbi:MAG TPA: AmmeMemoRadiSam system protein A [Candidatus Acidoferrales bacterium]|nr:AmmeMemoRadiSam system protein A [Candidatus Acidoferrales bacterium]
MSPLPRDDQRTLLELARRAISESLSRLPPFDVPTVSVSLDRPAGAFVTLYREGQLRGCIGRIEAVERLVKTVVDCAVGAAFHDPRFTPVVAEELSLLLIEISVLSPATPIRPEAVEVGLHGLVISREPFRGVLLPKVAAERGWTSQRFLEETCRKAGLPPDAWRNPETECLSFTNEVFSEAEFKEGHSLPKR